MINNQSKRKTLGCDALIGAHCPVNGHPGGGEENNERGRGVA